MTDRERIRAIEAACPGADAAFILRHVESRTQPNIAAQEWQRVQSRRAVVRQTAPAPAPRRPDVPAALLSSRRGTSHVEDLEDALTAWPAAVEAEKKPGVSNFQACQRANRKHPELREAFVAASNEGR